MTEPARPDRILVLDGASRAAVEVVQSLGRRGLEVHVAARADCPAFHSRWTAERLPQPSTSDSRRFLDWLRARADAYALVVPSTGYSLHHLAGLPASDALRARALLPSPEALQIALDKARTLEVAARLGIDVPTSSRSPHGDGGASGPFPRVLKPVYSIVEQGDDLGELSPVLVRDAQQRQAALERLLQHCPALDQDMVSGIGIGVECLYANGQLVHYFAHERLHEGTGGGLGSGSFYRKSISPPAPLLEAARALLEALNWHGVAMVEFKYDRESGRSWLMEINPRLWGSVALAIDAGVDFPYGMYCVATDKDPGPQPKYRRPYYTRLVPQDLEWIGRQIRRSGASRARELLSLFRLLIGRESWDHFAWADPRPLLRSSALFLGEKRGALESRRLAREEATAALRQHASNLPRLRARGAARRILFVCTGNICRSPLAAALWHAQHPAMKIASAGFIGREGRCSSDNVRAAALALGVSLAEHRSRTLDETMLRESDLVVLFEPRNFAELSRAFPQYADKIVMLGAMLRPARTSIDDPYQRTTAETEYIAAQVDAALAELASFLGLPATSSAARATTTGPDLTPMVSGL